jgi:hypothetical protein
MAAGTSVPYFASRSWTRNLGAAPNGRASRNCWMIQQLVGCLVMFEMQDTPAIMTDDEETVEDTEIVGTVKKSSAAIASV